MTGGEIETYLFDGMREIIAADKASLYPMVSPELSGSVYYRGTRPLQNEEGATAKEDVVVAVIAGNDRQIQKGSCVVNVYVPDTVVASGAHMKNKSRTDMLEAWAKTLPLLLSRRGDVTFSRSSMVLTLPEDSIKQHFVSLKMDFKLLNENSD